MLAFRDDINGHEAAKAYAEDYRSPGKLRVTVGRSDATDAGDYDADGSHVPGLQDQRVDWGRASPRSASVWARRVWADCRARGRCVRWGQVLQLLDQETAMRRFVLATAACAAWGLTHCVALLASVQAEP